MSVRRGVLHAAFELRVSDEVRKGGAQLPEVDGLRIEAETRDPMAIFAGGASEGGREVPATTG